MTNAKQKLIIFGSGDMARMAHFYFMQDLKYELCAFTVTKEYCKDQSYLGLPLVPFEDIKNVYPPNEYEMFIAIGYSKFNQLRAEYYYKAKEQGYKLASYISPSATVLTNEIGDNVFIFEDNTIQPYVKIGNDVILWSGNHVGHDAVIEDHCFITSHVVLAGWTVVGKYTFIGINATIRDKVKIAERCLIGAGALITSDTKPNGFYRTQSSKLSDIPLEKLKGI